MDPNNFAEDGTTSLAGLSFSKNGKWVFVCGHLLDDVFCDADVGIIYVSTLSDISESSKIFVGDLSTTI